MLPFSNALEDVRRHQARLTSAATVAAPRWEDIGFGWSMDYKRAAVTAAILAFSRNPA
jgi:hypothetical protein